jgi:2-dehydro-3-deoxygluconokinase
MIRFSPPNHERLDFATQVDFKVGGSESNVAVALSRLGLKAGWISKLTDNTLGRRIENELKRWNVNVEGIIWTPDYRVGTYYAELGSDPRPTNVLYDRADSAISHISTEELDWTYLEACRLFHTSGITMALSPNCEEVVKACFEYMREKKKATSFDINYRSRLWAPEKAKSKLEEILPFVDILISSENDLNLLFGTSENLREKCAELMERFSFKVIVVTRSSDPTFLLDENKEESWGKGYHPAVIDRIGAGDAFAAGFLYGYLLGDLKMALSYGEAMSALKFSIPGDFAILNKSEVEEFIRKGGYWIKR